MLPTEFKGDFVRIVVISMIKVFLPYFEKLVIAFGKLYFEIDGVKVKIL